MPYKTMQAELMREEIAESIREIQVSLATADTAAKVQHVQNNLVALTYLVGEWRSGLSCKVARPAGRMDG